MKNNQSDSVNYEGPQAGMPMPKQGQVALSLVNINKALDETNAILADIERLIYVPKPCETTSEIAPIDKSVPVLFDSLGEIGERINGYNQCLRELHDVLRSQLGENLKLG